MTPRLRLNGLRHKYGGDNQVLHGVDLQVAPGETVAIIGRSGSGKSTLLKCICVLERPEAGNAEIDGQLYLKDGKPLFAPWEIRSNNVMVFQEYNLFPNMTALRNITLALENVRHLSRTEAEERAHEVARRLGIGSLLDRFPNQLSGGQAQRLALCRALVLHPKVLCLDEITAALDAETILDVIDAIKHIRSYENNRNMAIVLVTHLMRFAVEFADRVAYLHNGQIWEDLPAKSFLTYCEKPETQQFVAKFRVPF
jgi:polar amino acid transport system ATP-binding protein